MNKFTLLATSLAVVGAGCLLGGCSGPFSSLDAKGPAAADVAMLWWIMFGGATVILLAVVALWLYAIKRRSDSDSDSGSDNDRDSDNAQPPSGRGWLIGGGLILPATSIAALLVVGLPVGQRILAPADNNALTINVTGHQWSWRVHYPEHAIHLTDELHIPVNTPVYLQLKSADVIHSFWVPRLGVKLDMLPGRTNVLRLEASEAGVYRGQCAEYCGLGHAHMQFSVIAHEPPAFSAWLQEHRTDDR